YLFLFLFCSLLLCMAPATSAFYALSLHDALPILLKSLRGLCLDLAGRRTDLIVSATLFERILGMPLALRPARIGSFAQNIHDFQGLRDFLSSLTLTSLIDLPFCLLALMAIAWLGGPLVWVPLLAFPLTL